MDSMLRLVIGIVVGQILGYVFLILFGNPFEWLESKIRDFKFERYKKKLEKERKQKELEEAKKPFREPYEWRDL